MCMSRAMLPTDRLRCFLVDDHPLLRDAVAVHLQSAGHTVVGQASTVADTLRALAQSPIDLLVTDICLPDGDAAQLLQTLATRGPLPATLVLSMRSEAAWVQRLQSLGVRGYVRKADPSALLRQAVACIVQGGSFFSPHLPPLSPVPPAPSPAATPALTPREREILQLLAEGATSKEMAQRLAMSERTAESHRLRLRRKLQLEGYHSLVHYALSHAAPPEHRLPSPF